MTQTLVTLVGSEIHMCVMYWYCLIISVLTFQPNRLFRCFNHRLFYFHYRFYLSRVSLWLHTHVRACCWWGAATHVGLIITFLSMLSSFPFISTVNDLSLSACGCPLLAPPVSNRGHWSYLRRSIMIAKVCSGWRRRNRRKPLRLLYDSHTIALVFHPHPTHF